MRHTPSRLGTAALAAATVLTGLGLAAPASAEPISATGSTPVVISGPPVAPSVTRLVGPLTLIDDDTLAYGLRLDADTLRTTTAQALADAQAGTDYFSVPAPGQVGPVRGTGDKANRCLTKGAVQYVSTTTCNGSAAQDWQWTTTIERQGETHALSPATDTSRAVAPRGENTFVSTVTSADTKRPMALGTVMAADRALDAAATADSVAKSATVTGWATSGAKVAAGGVTTVAAKDGTFTLTVDGLEYGQNTITVTQTLPNGLDWGTLDVDAVIDTVVPTEGALTELERDAATPVTVGVTTAAEWTRQVGTMVLTAPEGTTFAEGQTKLNGQLKHPGGDWNNDTNAHALHDGVLSADKRTYTYQYRGTVNGYGMQNGSQMRWTPQVVVDAGAPATTGQVDFVFAGTGSAGDYRAAGHTPTAIDDAADAPADLVVTSHDAEDTYTTNERVTLGGTATPGAEVTVYWFGKAHPNLAVTTTAGSDGTWAATRGLGTPTIYDIVITQTAQSGKVNEASIRLSPEQGDAADLTLTSPKDGDTFDATKATTVTGTATPGATVTAYWFGKDRPTLATSVIAGATGDYAFSRGLGGMNPYDIVLTQTAQADKVNEISFRLNPEKGAPADLTLTSHQDGDAFDATGLTTLRGTATPGATVTAYWFGKDHPTLATTTTAGADGSYAIARGLGGTKPYMITLTQTEQADTTNEVTVQLVPTP